MTNDIAGEMEVDECLIVGPDVPELLRIRRKALDEGLHRTHRRLDEQPIVVDAQRRNRHDAALEAECIEAGAQPVGDDLRVSPLFDRPRSARSV